jgi:hypothetical protein
MWDYNIETHITIAHALATQWGIFYYLYILGYLYTNMVFIYLPSFSSIMTVSFKY